MTADPTVCAIMLTRDRPELARRAVECFRKQRYANKRMIIYNTNAAMEYGHIAGITGVRLTGGVIEVAAGFRGLTIGAMRNDAIAHADYPIIIHWDDDDWSDPQRIPEQVDLLQSSGVDAVGYRECLFDRGGEAWLYTSPWPIGASLCYWRRVWEAKPFPDLPKNPEGAGEDVIWRQGLRTQTASANVVVTAGIHYDTQPRMICRIHGGNTVNYSALLDDPKYKDTWKRVPEWDERVKEILS